MTSEWQNLWAAGRLDEAIAAMNGEVRKNPTDIDRRAILAELLSFAGNLERADTILASIEAIDPRAAVGVSLFRQLVRAEQARQQFWSEGRVPEFLAMPEGSVECELKAAVAWRAGALVEAAALAAEGESLRPKSAGTLDNVAFDDFRDLDDLTGAHFEVLTSTGKYFWVPVARVSSIEFRAPERRRDLLWRRAAMSVIGGPDGEVFIPTIYAAPAQDIDAQYRLGRTTDFAGPENGPMTGKGLRSFLVGEDSKTVLELGKIEFSRP